MSRPGILVTARFHQNMAPQLAKRADVAFHDWSTSRKRMDSTELTSLLRGRRILVTEIDQVDQALLEACPDLSVVITCRGNPVNVDIPACTERGVLALNTPGRNAEAVADMAVGLIIACARHLVPAAALIREGGWSATGQRSAYFRFQGIDMDDATVGLVGLGAVARAVRRRLRGFGTRVLAYDPYISAEVFDDLDVVAVDLPALMAESDFVSLHVHVTEETAGMIGEEQLACMKPTAFLINTARAGAVDQEAMYRALKEKRIAGAALDVFSQEPLPADSPLRELDNVILTPHLGGATPGQTKVQTRIVVEQALALLDGREPPHMLNPKVAKTAIEALRR